MPPLGKYFLIRSPLSDLVLGLEAGNITAGSAVVTCPESNEKEARECQLWHRDDNTNTIRNRRTKYCLDLKDSSTLVVNPYQDFREKQMWEVDGNRIRTQHERSMVLEIEGNHSEPGGSVVAGKEKGKKQSHQCWNIEYQPARFFFIKSQMNGKIVEVYNCDPTPGVAVVMNQDSQCQRDGQLWYEAQDGIIRCKLNDYPMDASGENVCMQPYSADNPRQQWLLCGDVIRNRQDATEVLDILRRCKQNNAYVGAYKFHGKANQRWDVVYLDQLAKESFTDITKKVVKAPVTLTKKLFKK